MNLKPALTPSSFSILALSAIAGWYCPTTWRASRMVKTFSREGATMATSLLPSSSWIESRISCNEIRNWIEKEIHFRISLFIYFSTKTSFSILWKSHERKKVNLTWLVHNFQQWLKEWGEIRTNNRPNLITNTFNWQRIFYCNFWRIISHAKPLCEALPDHFPPTSLRTSSCTRPRRSPAWTSQSVGSERL